jgi:hypothetical protein
MILAVKLTHCDAIARLVSKTNIWQTILHFDVPDGIPLLIKLQCARPHENTLPLSGIEHGGSRGEYSDRDCCA